MGEEIGLAERPAAQPSVPLFARYWLPVLTYVSLILALSAQQGLPLPFLFPHADKVCHVLEYLGLGLLLVRACRGGLAGRAPIRAARWALGLGVLVGASDEIFQSTVPTRTASVYDLLADTGGLLLAQIVYLLSVRE